MKPGAKAHGIIVHGLGRHDDDGYADAFVHKIRKEVEAAFGLPSGGSKKILDFTAVSWSPIYEDSRQLYRAHYLDVIPALQSTALSLAELGFHLMGYSRRKDAIMAILAAKIAGIANHSPQDPIVVIGHSWGAVILYDFLFDLFENYSDLPPNVKKLIPQKKVPQLEKQIRVFISMGSPLGLCLASYGHRPAVLEKLTRRLLAWENYRLQLDPIGHPLYGSAVIDIPGALRDPSKNHFAYWKSSRVTKAIAQWFVKLLS